MEESSGQARAPAESRVQKEEESAQVTPESLRSFVPLRTSRACDVSAIDPVTTAGTLLTSPVDPVIRFASYGARLYTFMYEFFH
jgi:hypothetical protein